jgi:hypothetical protein
MTVAGLVIKPVLVVCVRSGGALEVVKCVLVGPAWFRFGFFAPMDVGSFCGGLLVLYWGDFLLFPTWCGPVFPAILRGPRLTMPALGVDASLFGHCRGWHRGPPAKEGLQCVSVDHKVCGALGTARVAITTQVAALLLLFIA